MNNLVGFICCECSKEFGVPEIQYVCPSCSGNLDAVYDYARAAGQLNKAALSRCEDRSMWRYRPVLPLEPTSALPPLLIGGTPLYNAERLARELGLREILIKDEGGNPTGSLKDRPSGLAVVKAREAGASIITTASSGNAGAALAGSAASVGLTSVIFVPASAPPAKMAQLQIYGATVIAVDASYDDAVRLCLESSRSFGWYQRSTGYNPYTREGKKTVALEIAEQLNWDAPDAIFVPVGDGNIISGVWKAFRDLLGLKLIERAPRLIGVQADAASAIVDAVDGRAASHSRTSHTIADGIDVRKPNDATMAVRAIRESGGCGLRVSDEEILASIARLAASTGVFAEPAAAAAFAGLVKARQTGAVESNERVVLLITGNGLKDVAAARRAAGEPARIRPTLEDLLRAHPEFRPRT
jgi:threonine synthase